MSAPQHMAALERATTIRLESAQIRREIKAGTLTAREALVDPRAGCLTVERLLSAQRRWGPHRVAQSLHGTHISPHRKVRDLTERQVGVIDMMLWRAAQ